MANYNNNLGQTRLGWRTPVVTNSPVQQTNTISASLLQSLYGVWNGDTTTNELSTSLYGVWNGEYSGTASLETSLYGVWNGESTTNTLDTSLYALYKAEGNANDSVGTNHGTLLYGATFSTGKIGTKSFYFDGVNDYISLPNNSLNFTGDFSISVWVDVSSISTWQHVFNPVNNISGNYGWRLVINGNSYAFNIGNGTAITQLYFEATYDSIAQISPLVGTAMKNVVITRKAGVGTKMYINGVLKASNNSIVNPSYLATMTPKFGDGNTINKLDNIGFWNKELSNLEAIQLYNNNVGVDYPFNGNLLQSTNDVFGSNHGTLMNGTTFTTGKIGNAFSFDGVNDYVELPSTSLRMTGDFTISCWFYMNTQSTYNAFVENFYGINVSNRYGWALYYQSGKIRFGTYNVSTAITVGSTTITTGQWYHLVVTKTTTGSPKIYLNGVLESSTVNAGPTTLHPIYNSNNIPRFGVDVDAGGWGGYLNGRLDSVNVWNRELTSNEVSMLYNGSNGTQYQSGSFGLTQSSLDSFGTYHGTLVNTTYGTGKFGTAFNFNGSNTYVSMGTGAGNFGSNSFSISGWFYPNVGNVLQMLVAKGTTTATNKGFAVAIDNRYNSNQRALTFGLVGNNSNYQNITTTTTNQYTIGNWNHFTVVWDSTNKSMKIYLNGVQATTTTTLINGTGASGISDISNTSAELLFGQYGDNTSKFNGKLDSVTMWNRVVSVDEVTQLYNSGTGAQYPFTGTFSSAINQLGVDNGTLMNGCYLSDGKIGKAFTFDGINDFVLLPTNSMRFTGDFSYSFFVSLGNTSGAQTVFSCENYLSNENGDRGYIINFTNGLLKFLGYYNSTIIINSSSTTTVTANTWNHFVVTKTSSQVKIYMNGVLQTTTNYTGIIAYNSVVYPSIGVTYKQNNVNNANYDYISAGSKIDALTAYQKELTQSEITELYNSGNGKQITTTPIVQSGLVLNLDASRSSSYTGTGTTWTDISGNGNNGTLVSGPIFGTANGGGITFDGVNDRITLQNANISATGNWTISSWFNLSSLPEVDINSTNKTHVIYSQYISIPGNGRMILRLLNESGIVNKFQLFLGSGSGYSNQGITGTTTAQINTFYNLVGIRNGSVFSLYLNGNLEASLDLTGTNISILQTTPEIGGTISGNFGWLNGKIYNTLVYNRALSATEITQNFNSTKGRFGL